MTVVQGLMLTYTQQQPIPGHVAWFTVFGAGSLGPIARADAHPRRRRHVSATGGSTRLAADATSTRSAAIPTQLGWRASILDLYRFLPYVFSGFCAALSGVLLASLLNTSTIHIGLDTPLAVLAAAIMGGASLLGGRGLSRRARFSAFSRSACSRMAWICLGVFTYYQIAIRAVILIAVVVIDSFYTTPDPGPGAAAGARGVVPPCGEKGGGRR